MTEQSQEQQAFSIQKMVEDAKTVLLSPKKYFTSMPLKGGLGEPIIKALIYGTIAGIFRFLWSILNVSVATGGIFSGHAIGIMALIWSIIGAVIGLFIGAVIILIISAICSGSTDFEANVRVSADMMILLPVGAIFGFLGGISFLSVVIRLAINLYGLWMLYNALNESLKANPKTSKIVTLVLAGLLVLFLFIGLGTKKAVHSLTKDPEKTAEKIVRQLGGDEAAKTVKEAYKTAKQEDVNAVVILGKPDGDRVKNPEISDITEAINSLKSEDEFVILNRGKNFLQVAKSGEGYLLQYKDGSGFFESKNTDFAPEIIIATFNTYLIGGTGWGVWKQQFEWKPAEH